MCFVLKVGFDRFSDLLHQVVEALLGAGQIYVSGRNINLYYVRITYYSLTKWYGRS